MYTDKISVRSRQNCLKGMHVFLKISGVQKVNYEVSYYIHQEKRENYLGIQEGSKDSDGRSKSIDRLDGCVENDNG